MDYDIHLDVPNEGNFNTRSPEEAKTLIEYVTSSDGLKALLEGQVRFQPTDEAKTSSHEEDEDVNQFPF
ncbi:hypothetical protein DY000_02021880 [Brassica cretica]|uniref:Uncharacterized protein n=1 Tax=Brassica cretica TaxID=69181 RepID=A0ABQ7E8V6_BRACR|nr:hypothetical protein DY000_02021880 [Brassica cretica]